ncbi:MAG: flippase-like domain-containing protein [Planctomycetes bacterium]|nr:flippase-like domain-containing protein [Planctomycetota bacterium]
MLILPKFNLPEAWRQVTALSPQRLLLPLLISLVTIPVRPLRWQWMFSREHRPSFSLATRAFYISLLVNNLLPARGGDVLRCFLVGQDPSLRNASRVLGTLGVEKALDGIALLFVVTLSLVFLDLAPWLERLAALSGLVLCGGSLMLWSLQRRPDVFRRLVLTCCRFVRKPALGKKIELLFASFAEGLSAVGSVRKMAALVVLTAVLWGLEGALVWALAAAMGVPLSLAGGALVVAVLGLGMMVPAAPGFVGTYEFFATAILTALGATPDSALALTLLMHAWFLLVTTGVGAAALAGSGIGLSRAFAARATSSVREREAEEYCDRNLTGRPGVLASSRHRDLPASKATESPADRAHSTPATKR